MTYNDRSYGDFWRDLRSHASNFAGSGVTHSTFKKRKQITKGLIQNSTPIDPNKILQKLREKYI